MATIPQAEPTEEEIVQRHSTLRQNFEHGLTEALKGRDCRVFGPEVRLRISKNAYVNADVSVTCGTPQLVDGYHDIIVNPVVVVEVLSPATERYDRGQKFQTYRRLETVKDYLLVAQDRTHIEQFTRQNGRIWTYRYYEAIGDGLVIGPLGVTVPLSRIYQGIEG